MDKENKGVTIETNCIIVSTSPEKHQTRVDKGELGKKEVQNTTPENEIVKTLKGEKFFTPDEIRAAKEARAKARARAEKAPEGDTRA